MRKVEQSILAPAIVEARIIPHGVDLTAFHPDDRDKVRDRLGIPQAANVLLFVGSTTTRSNPWDGQKRGSSATRAQHRSAW